MIQKRLTRILIAAFLCSATTLFSQSGSFNYENELSQRAPVPQAPEAAAFAQYGDVGVNMYTGTPNVEVPIYIHQGRELNLPINLSYNATGIKVTQMPTPVGLGWNLNVGGRISRMVNGLPDDYINASTTGAYTSWYSSSVKNAMITYSHPDYRFGVGTGGAKVYGSEQEAKDYLEFLDKVHDQEYETQPDYYNLNVMGMNETFVLDLSTKQPFSLTNPNTDITRGAIGQDGINTFIVKSDNGTQYTFQAVDETRLAKYSDTGSHFMYGTNVRYKSSWYLTEVISPTGKDVYTFSYLSYTDNRERDYGGASVDASNIMRDQPNDRIESISRSGAETFFYNRKILDKVTHNGKVIIDVDFVNSFGGGPDVAINSINIYNDGSTVQGTSLSKSYTLDYSYFKTGSSEPISISNKDKIRLKLDAVHVKDASLTTVESYSFDYVQPYSISDLNSKGQDYLGFYNGANNTVLYPKSASSAGGFPYSYGYQFPGSTTGGIRSPNFGYAKRGLLSEINYPTGGRTVFEYEQARTRKPDNSTATQLVEKININHNSVNLPAVSSNECNRLVNGITYSADVETQSFSVGPEEIGTHYLSYTRTGTPTILGLGIVPKSVVLVKKPDATINYLWSEIYDNNCNILIPQSDLIWLYEGSDTTVNDNFFLTEGDYQVFVMNYDTGYTKTLQIEGPEPYVIYNFVEELRAGIRVKNIKNYTENSTVATQKSFEYESGIEITTPIFEYITQERYATVPYGNFPPGETPMTGNYQVVHRVSQPINGDKQHIAYPKVKELSEDPSDSSNTLTTVYQFNTPNKSQGVYSQGNYKISLPGGQFSSNNYSMHPNFGDTKDTESLNSKTSSKYSDKREFYSTFGLATNMLGKNNDQYPVIVSNGSGGFRIDMQLGQLVTNNAYGDHGYFFTAQPVACNGEENCSPEIARLQLHKTNAYGYHGAEVEQKTTTTDEVTQIINYTYTAGDKRYMKSTTTEGSDEEDLTVMYTYPHELSGEYAELLNANILNVPVVVEEHKDTTLLTTTKTLYNTLKLPQEILTSKEDNSLETRLNFEQYLNGNVVQVRQEDGIPVSFIWGYNDRYVVAKINNATYNSLPTSLVNQIRTTNDETQLLNYLDSLRSSISAQMTSYTYKPNIGVSTIVDVSGIRTTYLYDDYQRLQYIVDKDGNVAGENDYNYKQ